MAWQRHFEEGPAFFMAVNGRLAFADGASAAAAMKTLVHTIQHVELQWGDDLRIDALAPELAVVAASYHEVRVDAAGVRIDEDGFFTGVVERRGERWRFRDAHWSVPIPAAAPH
jgi:hypothetical protein